MAPNPTDFIGFGAMDGTVLEQPRLTSWPRSCIPVRARTMDNQTAKGPRKTAPGGREDQGKPRRPCQTLKNIYIIYLSGPLAFSDSMILLFGLGPETIEIPSRRAGFQPPGPVETFVSPLKGRRLQPRVGGPGGGPVLAPSGCPGEAQVCEETLKTRSHCLAPNPINL